MTQKVHFATLKYRGVFYSVEEVRVKGALRCRVENLATGAIVKKPALRQLLVSKFKELVSQEAVQHRLQPKCE